MSRISRSDASASRLMDTLAAIGELPEVKQNYNPNQPREPKGSPAGGRWAIVSNGSWRGIDTSGINRATRVAAARVDAFLLKHRKAITRILGAIQALDGLGEAAAGVRLGGAGVATSHVGVGVLAAGLAGWMVKHGYDNVEAGILALATGYPQETNLFKSLRDLGLSEAATGRLELALSGGGVLGGGFIARRALQNQMRLALTRRALRAFDPAHALDVRLGGKSLWDAPDIRARGDAWEAFDAQRTGYERFPNARVFDQISADRRVAVSNKTLDLYRETYLKTDRRALFHKLKLYIDQAASFTPYDPARRQSLALVERRLHLLLRFGDAAPGQELQIAAAEQYARDAGVILKVEYAP